MPFTARVSQNSFHQLFSPPGFSSARQALPLLTELDTVIQTESSQDIAVEDAGGNVQFLTAHRTGFNIFRVTDKEST